MAAEGASVHLAHPRAAALAVVGLAGSWLVSIQRPVPSWELTLTDEINELGDGVADVLYPVMQLGTAVAPVVVALVVLVWRRDVLFAAATVAAGLLSWFLAKGVKEIVDRGRPLEYVPRIQVREGDGSGLGFVSGHSAVAAATAVMVAAQLPRHWRWAPLALAGLVGFARVVHGVHLPADVVGGWSLGALVGIAALSVVEAIRKPEVVGR